jgi:CubicO group peptidase (beta-lactamase class C family)
MRPRDLAKIGAMLLDRGRWQGSQIVPAGWVIESLRPHVAAPDGLGYGYLWWAGTVDHGGRRLAWSGAFGNGGQRLLLVPELDLVVVFTAGAYNQTEIRGTLAHLFERIVSAVRE